MNFRLATVQLRRRLFTMTSQADRDEQKWNHISETMLTYHNYFKGEFNNLYELADGSWTKRGMSLSLYLDKARQLNQHLTMHHTIEERHIFPILATKMPQFSTETDDGHLESHRGIHQGLDQLATLVSKFKKEPSTYSPDEMRACLDGFREVLFRHLDQEVSDLQGENMKKYWTLKELDLIPIAWVSIMTLPSTATTSVETLPLYEQEIDKRRSLEDAATPLPDGWFCKYDEHSKHHYYVDMNSSPPRSVWQHPRHDPPPPPPSIKPARKGFFGKLRNKIQEMEAESAQQEAQKKEQLLERYAKRREQVIAGLATTPTTFGGHEYVGPPESPYGGKYCALMPQRVDDNMAGWLG
ncbi:Hemerythrin domain-containing protein [Mycena indigotica]|uniref:Hemerythrin domain-containing protein n=1 Tax=Mycena indigotica TaxID=2126181 RepID=A0A8H6TE52_9AGAR|nr:Hemerythrin domain-containing protein [Mycena indigotica]KAF7315619.1 Hemerythrin domain-containing protein [Mycena indigotica]